VSFGLFDAAVTLAVIAAVLVLMWVTRRAAKYIGLSHEAQRKLVHVATGCAALAFPLVFSNPLPVFILTGAAIVVMLVLRSGTIASTGIGSVLHGVERKSFGEIYLTLAIALIFFRSQGNAVLYVLPVLVVTLSDTASALIGTSYGRNRFAVADGSKSLEGVAAFFVVTWLSGMITLLLMTDAGRGNVIVLSLLIAMFCALVEADSWRGLDNLFVPVAAHLLLARHLSTGTMELTWIAVLFAAAVVFMLSFAPLMRISGHAARAYTILAFMILSVTAPHNAILPIAAAAMHIPARIVRPGKGDHPDLDLLAAATAVALLWLIAGELIGRSAINLFGLTYAGAATAFAGLALTGRWRLAVVPVAAVFALAFIGISGFNEPDETLLMAEWPLVAASIAVPALAVLWRPDWFDTHRAVKALALAMVVPVIIFISRGFA
jgi:phytol kinase